MKMVGTEVRPEDGFEYMLAVVGKKTGLIKEFRPTALVEFQAMFNPPESVLRGEK